MKCQECNQEFKNFKGLSMHIGKQHNNESYYNKWINNEKNNHFCKCCGKPTKFYSIYYGYKKYCSKKCMKKDYSNEKHLHNPMYLTSAKENQQNTNMKRYGVSQNTKRPEIIEQIKQTNLKKYGVENVGQNKKIKAQALKHREETNLKKYGFKCALSNATIFEKSQKTGRTRKPFRNTNLYYQASYELDFLETYYDKYPDIQRGPTIKYFFNDEPKNYFPDFYIPSLNLIIEIKNSYHAKRDESQLIAKKEETIKQGYNFIMFINKKYTNF